MEIKPLKSCDIKTICLQAQVKNTLLLLTQVLSQIETFMQNFNWGSPLKTELHFRCALPVGPMAPHQPTTECAGWINLILKPYTLLFCLNLKNKSQDQNTVHIHMSLKF